MENADYFQGFIPVEYVNHLCYEYIIMVDLCLSGICPHMIGCADCVRLTDKILLMKCLKDIFHIDKMFFYNSISVGFSGIGYSCELKTDFQYYQVNHTVSLISVYEVFVTFFIVDLFNCTYCQYLNYVFQIQSL